MCPAAQAVLDRLENTRQRWWICSLACNLVFVFVVSFAAFGVCILTDVWLQLSQTWLGIALFLWTVLFVTLVVTAMYRGSQIPRSTEATARRVELSLPEAGSHLINLVQLTDSESKRTDPFHQAAINEAAANLQDVRFHKAADCHSRMSRWLLGLQTPQDLAERLAAFALVTIVAAGVNSMLPGWRSSADRLLTPWRFVPQKGSTHILQVTPGHADVLVGSRLEIRGEISDPGDRKPSAKLFISAGGRDETSQPMLPRGKGTSFSCVIPAVAGDFQYRLQIGDSQSDVYRVVAGAIPAVSRVDVTYQYPDYLRLPVRSVEQPHADLDAPQYSTAQLEFVSATPLSRGYVQLADSQVLGKIGADRRRLRATIPMVRSTTFTAHLFNEYGHADPEPRVNNVRVAQDSPPRVQLAKPETETAAAVGGILPAVVRASDDHGLSLVSLEWKRLEEAGGVESDEAIRTLHQWENVTGAAATLSHHLEWDSSQFSAGQAIQVRARASDHRRIRVAGTDLLPQESTSPWVTIKLISAEQAATDWRSKLDNLSAQLREILQTQQRNRSRSSELAKLAALHDASAIAETVRKGQIEVQTRTVAVAATIDSSVGVSAIKTLQMLRRLAYNEMLTAVEQTETLSESRGARKLAAHHSRLTETQDAIIGSLQRVLQLMGEENMVAKGEPPGGSSKAAEQPRPEVPISSMPSELAERVGQLMEEVEGLFDEIRNLAGSRKDSPGGEAGRKRMADQQAELRQRVAAVQINFQVLNYPQTDLNRIAELMRSVEADLRSARYQNALRQREVLLDCLKDIKKYLGGEIEIRQERWSHLPTEIREQLLGSMLDESPRGWAEWNQKYFQRLSEDVNPAADANARNR